jgi:hypothetical protein
LAKPSIFGFQTQLLEIIDSNDVFTGAKIKLVTSVVTKNKNNDILQNKGKVGKL